ncbi:MAG TPA: outer membrane protein transport protein [Alphaproteobacteria bacterium]|nr:outer membrane protein transport protein [Alphaproteobacteria bacterium]
MNLRLKRDLGAFTALSVLAVSGVASAGGFYIQEQSAAGVGRAQAGNVAIADDASTLYFNPAGLTQLPGIQIDSGLDLIVPDAGLHDQGSSVHSPFAGPNGIQGGNGGNPGSSTVIPDFYLSAQIPDSMVTLGFGVSAPFGFASKFEQNSFARYDSIDSFVETIDFQPTIALKLNKWLSLGVGLDEQYSYVKLRSAVPDPFTPGMINSDGRLTLTGHTWSTGFNGGLLIQPDDKTNIGLSYRYGITHNIRGSLTVANLQGLVSVANQQVTGTAALDLPDIVQVGVAHHLTPDLTLLAEFDYYSWSNFKAINIHTTSPTLGNLVTQEQYRDTYSFSVGAEYQLDPQWRIRGGVKYDQTPTVDAYRDTRVPDGDRVWLATGFHYQWSEHIGFDGSYAHIFVTDSNINIQRSFYDTVPAVQTFANIRAKSTVSLDLLTAGFTYKF